MNVGKGAAAAICLLFGLPFGAGGLFALWVIASTLADGYAVRDWVRVRADVLQYDGNGLRYRYDVGGRLYTGSKVGLGALDSNDVDAEIDERLTRAVNEKKPVTVFMNPDNPAQSVIDPRIPWMLMVGMTPFALAFTGVGVGAFWFLFQVLTGRADKPRRAQGAQVASAAGGALFLWIFAFFWNALSIPISIIALPDIWRSGQWLGLFILIFPLIGLAVLWSAISATWQALRRGRVTIEITGDTHRVGEALAGNVRFARGVNPGDRFGVKLVCMRTTRDGNTTRTASFWSKDVVATAVNVAGTGARVPFRIEVPADQPPSGPGEQRHSHAWQIEVRPADKPNANPATLPIELDEAVGAPQVRPEPPPPLQPSFVSALEGAAPGARTMTPEQRAAMAKLSTGQQEMVASLVRNGPMLKKLVIGVVVLFIALQVLGGIVALVAAFL